MKKIPILFVLVLGFFLTACGSTPDPVGSNPPTVVEKSPASQVLPQATGQDSSRSDSQGAITVEVNPQNLNNPGETLTFEVNLTTHSIELSMNLATLATLTTDNGRIVQATQWDGPRGGHHVTGTLSFPAIVGGRPVLEGASKLTLTIKDLDAPERNFTWDVDR